MASGRAMIVTGASSGIGRALAERAARAGYAVLAVGRREDRLAELVRGGAAHGGEIVSLALDLRDPGAAERIVAVARSRFGRIDVLVNNAGGTAVGALTAQSDAALREQFETHAIVPLELVREALCLLRVSRGHVFFLGSGVARIPVGGLGAYPSAKAAVRSLSRTLRNELQAHGIRVTYVDPGVVDTEFMTRAGMTAAPRSIMVSPHDVARKIFNAIGSDHGVLNAVPWQTAFVALAERFPRLTDAILARSPGLVGGPVPGGSSSADPVLGNRAVAGAEIQALAQPQSAAASEEGVPLSDPPNEPAPPAGSAAPDTARGTPADLARAARPDAVQRAQPPATPFEAALEPHAARMRKLNLRRDFIASLLVLGASLELGDVAMRWAGMPNKNERAATLEVLDALADANFLVREGPHRYRVIAAADAPG